MAGVAGGRHSLAVAVIMLLCAMVPDLSCFHWQGPGKFARLRKATGEATEMKVMPGRILFNGNVFSSRSLSAATGGNGLLHTDLGHLDATGEIYVDISCKCIDLIKVKVLCRPLSSYKEC